MKLIREKYKELLTDNDINNFKNDFKRIKKIHDKLLSNKKFILLRIVDVLLSLLPMVLFVVFVVLVDKFLNVTLKSHSQDTSVILAEDWLFGLTSGLLGAFILSTILSSLLTDNEYFDETELKIFLNINILRTNTVLYYFIIGTIYYVFAAILKIFSFHIHTISTLAFSIIYLSFVIISFVAFKCKTKIDRYLWYITSKELFLFRFSGRINSFRKCLTAFSNSSDPDNDYSSQFIKDSLIQNSNFYWQFKSLIKKLEEKAIKGYDIKNEQNIIEKYLLKFAKNIDCPHKMCAFNIMLNVYISTINDLKESEFIKKRFEFEHSIIQIVNAVSFEKFCELSSFKISIDNESYVYFLDFIDLCNMIVDIFKIQSLLVAMLLSTRMKIEEFLSSDCNNKKIENKMLIYFNFANKAVATHEKNTELFADYESRVLKKTDDIVKDLT